MINTSQEHEEPQQALAFGDEPIVLVGDPRRCVGVLHIHNPQKHTVKLRRLRLRAGAGLTAATCAPDAALELAVSASLCAGQTQMHRVKLRLAATTPPGCYAAELDGGAGVCHEVAVHVTPYRRVRISPAGLTQSVAAGGTLNLVVTVSNHGNVPAEIAGRAVLELHDGEVAWPNHFHSVAKSHGDEGFTAFLDAFFKKVGQTEPPIGRVKVSSGAGPLLPSTSRSVSLELAVPKGVHPGRMYRARVRLADARLSINLHIDAAEPSSAAGETTP